MIPASRDLVIDGKNYGLVAKHKTVGKSTIYLTHSTVPPGPVWWIVWQLPDRVWADVFHEFRREVCWDAFDSIGEASIEERLAWQKLAPENFTPGDQL